MADGDLQESGADEIRYHLGRGEETFGPYLRSELLQHHQDGLLTSEDFVWDDARQSWIPLPEFLEAAAPARDPPAAAEPSGIAYPCHAHPGQSSAAHCIDCGKLICLSCVQIKSGDLYCPDCAIAVKEESASPIQERITKSLGVFYDQPMYAVAAILILALVLMPGPGSKEVKKTDGIGAVESNRLWNQARRTLAVAQILSDLGQADRAKRWYDLSLASASTVVKDKSVTSLIREQVMMFEMRTALDLEQYDLLGKLIDDLGTEIERPLRHADLTFFKACEEYLRKKNPKRAIEMFEELTGADRDPFMNTDMVIEIMSKPYQTKENAEQLMGESYTEAEAYYRLGVCHDLTGAPDKARRIFYRVYNLKDSTGEITRWRKLAMKKIEARPGADE